VFKYRSNFSRLEKIKQSICFRTMLGESKKSFKLKLLSKYFYGKKTNQTKKCDKNYHHKKLLVFFSVSLISHISLWTQMYACCTWKKKTDRNTTDRQTVLPKYISKRQHDGREQRAAISAAPAVPTVLRQL